MEPQTTQPQPAKKSRTRLIVIAAGVLVVLCLCLTIIGAMNSGNDNDQGTAVAPVVERAQSVDQASTPAVASEPTQPPTPAVVAAGATQPQPTAGPVIVGLNEEVRTQDWALTVTGVERTDSLEWQGRRLEPVGQWVIVWAEVRNLTTEQTLLSGSDFKMTTPELTGEIKQNGSATRAATAVRYASAPTVADFLGMLLEAGSSQPIAVAFDVPPSAMELVLHVAGDAGAVTLGRVDAIAALPTTPVPTDAPTPALTDTPIPTTLHETSSPTLTTLSIGPVANTGANLRAGPGTNYEQVGKVSAGQTLELVATNQTGDWYKLASGSWIAKFLVDNAPNGLPVVEVSTPQSQPPQATALPSGAPVASPVRVGTHIVGDTIQPGIYRGLAGEGLFDSCYWARLSDLKGELESTIANDNAIGQYYVEVKATDFALETACQLIPLAQAPVLSVGDTLPPGTYLVGRDIRPGTYKGEAGADIMESCYWERSSDVAGTMESTLANDNATGSFFVQVVSSDFALKTACSLVRVGD